MGTPGKAALSMAATMPVSARLAAMERSIERVRMTAIWPSARIIKIDVSLKTVARLTGRAKPGAGPPCARAGARR